MDKSTNAADRVRHVLAAMERSIDTARRRRLDDERGVPTPAPTPSTPTASPISSSMHTPNVHDTDAEQEPPRLKARPKRDPRIGFNDSEYRFKAS